MPVANGQLIQNGSRRQPRFSSVLGPDGSPYRYEDGYALPQVHTFAQILNLVSRSWSFRYDEAVRHSRVNSLAMRRDCGLMALLRERQLATAQLNWHLEPDDESDPQQKAATDYLTTIIERTPHLQRLLMSLLEAIWYGRYGVQMRFDYRPLCYRPPEDTEAAQHPATPGVPQLPAPQPPSEMRNALCVVGHRPLNGDKIQFQWDGTPLVFVHAGARPELEEQGAEIVLTDRAPAIVLKDGYWRERFIIHHHEIDDADYFEGEMAGVLEGVGVRSRIYWMNWLKLEVQSWVVDFMERIGQGMTLFFYEEGNPQSLAEVKQAAEQYSRNTVIIFPRSTQGEKIGAGVDRQEVSTQGTELLMKVQEYFDTKMERYIVGQTLSSKAESTGLGSSVADLHAATKAKIIAFDAGNLAGTLTQDLVLPLLRWNIPGANFQLRWVFDVDQANAKEQLGAAKDLFDMGAEIDANEARGFAGLSKPKEGAEILVKAPGMPGAGPADKNEPQPMVPGMPGAPPTLPDPDIAPAPFAAEKGQPPKGPQRYAAQHAPSGGLNVQGRFYRGGEWIPSEVMDKATPEEKAKVVHRTHNVKPPKKRGGGTIATAAAALAQMGYTLGMGKPRVHEGQWLIDYEITDPDGNTHTISANALGQLIREGYAPPTVPPQRYERSEHWKTQPRNTVGEWVEQSGERVSPEPVRSEIALPGHDVEVRQAAKQLLEKQESVPRKWLGRVRTAMVGRYRRLEGRYGRKTALAILGAMIVAPPGTGPVTLAVGVGVAELYLRLSKKKAAA